MEIDLNDIKRICEIILDKAIQSGFKKIKINADNYWIVDSDERKNFDAEQPKLSVGSLIDDMESLQKVLSGVNIATPVEFDRIASILVAIGDEVSHSPKIY